MLAITQQQIQYYRLRAAEYDDAYVERMDLTRLVTVLDTLPIQGDVLELACGTGQWTQFLAPRSRSLTAVDAAPEMLSAARDRTSDTGTRFIEADIFGWVPDRQYDTIFFAFWLSHVPPELLPQFWQTLRLAPKPGGHVVLLDDSRRKLEIEEVEPGADIPMVRRRLADGSSHSIVKVLHSPAELTGQLRSFGWAAQIQPVDPYHYSGVAQPLDGS